MSPVRRGLANLVIVFILYTSLLMACPWPSVVPKVQPYLQPALPILRNLGLLHRFRLFVDPPRSTGHVEFRVVKKDGTSSVWQYPRSTLMPGDPPGSYNRYLFIYLFWDYSTKTETLIPSMSQYIADQSAKFDGEAPEKVEIWQKTVPIPDPEFGMGQPLPTPSNSIRVSQYDLQTKWLRTVRPPLVW